MLSFPVKAGMITGSSLPGLAFFHVSSCIDCKVSSILFVKEGPMRSISPLKQTNRVCEKPNTLKIYFAKLKCIC